MDIFKENLIRCLKILETMTPSEREICISSLKRIIEGVATVVHSGRINIQEIIDNSWKESHVQPEVNASIPRTPTNIIRLTVTSNDGKSKISRQELLEADNQDSDQLPDYISLPEEGEITDEESPMKDIEVVEVTHPSSIEELETVSHLTTDDIVAVFLDDNIILKEQSTDADDTGDSESKDTTKTHRSRSNLEKNSVKIEDVKLKENEKIKRFVTTEENVHKGPIRRRKSHPRSSILEEDTVCKICNKSFHNTSNLTVHMRTHSGQKPYKCDICDLAFSVQSNLKRHLSNHKGIKRFECDVCGKKFAEKKSMYTHRRIHTGEKPYSCELCGKAFTQLSTLNSHKLIHTGWKGLFCDVCGKNFRQKTALQVHMKRHNAEKHFSCPDCGQTFVTLHERDRHLITHTDEKPYLCSKCPKRFSRTTQLQDHLNWHLGRKPHQCVICGEEFSDRQHLARHRQQHQRQQQQLAAVTNPCPVCDATFSKLTDLSQHLIAEHSSVISSPAEIKAEIAEDNNFYAINDDGSVSQITLTTDLAEATVEGGSTDDLMVFNMEEEAGVQVVCVGSEITGVEGMEVGDNVVVENLCTEEDGKMVLVEEQLV